MVDTRKIALGLFGINLVILANIAIADGDIVKVTTDPLVSAGDEVTSGQMDETTTQEYSGDSNVTPKAGDLEISTTEGTECVCDCNCPGQDCLTPEQCAEISQGEAQEEHLRMPIGEASTVEIVGDGIKNGAKNANIAAYSSDATNPGSPAPICLTPGVQPDLSDCHAYQDCSSIGSLDGSLHLVSKFCQPYEAFSVEFGRCSRDISSCPNNTVCLFKGGIADPASNTSYYWCEPRLVGVGFRIFHVNCSVIERFYPELGKCFIDINNMPQPPYSGFPAYNWNQLKDVDVVKAEIKLIKEQDKLKLKTEKDRLKMEQRLQKEQQKLKKEMAKQESATFVCPQAGNYPSQVSETIFFMCVPKKSTFKVVVMECPIGSIFSPVSGICVVGTPQNTGIPSAANVERKPV